MTARRRLEILSYGQDEFKQGTFTDPFGSIAWLGMRIPTLSTATISLQNGTPPYQNRYLFLGAAFSVAEGSRCRILGYRQLYEIGYLQNNATAKDDAPPTPRIFTVTSPGWSFPDATVTWHFRRLGPPNAQGLQSFRPSNATDLNNFRKGFGMTSALLYQSYAIPAGDAFYTDLTNYTPPNGGRPYGKPLSDDPRLSNVYGLQTDWKTPDAWGSLDMEVRGPDTVCAFISAAQTDPGTRPKDLPLPLNQGGGFYGSGMAPEDVFLANASLFQASAIGWRVGVSLVVEVDSIESDVRVLVGGERRTG